jgi:hypothetical protein
MNQLVEGVVSIALAIVGVAILSVLVSKQANTAGVIQAASGGFATALNAATNPFSGGGSASLGIGSGSYGVGGLMM